MANLLSTFLLLVVSTRMLTGDASVSGFAGLGVGVSVGSMIVGVSAAPAFVNYYFPEDYYHHHHPAQPPPLKREISPGAAGASIAVNINTIATLGVPTGTMVRSMVLAPTAPTTFVTAYRAHHTRYPSGDDAEAQSVDANDAIGATVTAAAGSGGHHGRTDTDRDQGRLGEQAQAQDQAQAQASQATQGAQAQGDVQARGVSGSTTTDTDAIDPEDPQRNGTVSGRSTQKKTALVQTPTQGVQASGSVSFGAVPAVAGTVGAGAGTGVVAPAVAGAGSVGGGAFVPAVAGSVGGGTILPAVAGTLGALGAGTVVPAVAGTVGAGAGNIVPALAGAAGAGTIVPAVAGAVGAGTIVPAVAGAVGAGTIVPAVAGAVGAGTVVPAVASAVNAGTTVSGHVNIPFVTNLLAGLPLDGFINGLIDTTFNLLGGLGGLGGLVGGVAGGGGGILGGGIGGLLKTSGNNSATGGALNPGALLDTDTLLGNFTRGITAGRRGA